MPERLLTRAQVRELDRRAIEQFGIAGVVLMENAGRGAAELLCSLGIQGQVMVCCGKGNNGGDGFVIARHLATHGVAVQVLLFARPADLTGDAATNFQILSRSGLAIQMVDPLHVDEQAIVEQFSRADWLVDALFGTGLTGPVRPPFDKIIRTMNASGVRTFAVDIPSGLDCDTGIASGTCVVAKQTATFAALKWGFINPAAGRWLGQLHCIDIGIPPAAYTAEH